jgi:hypothetical protein
MRIQFASQFFRASQSIPFGRLIKPVAPTLFLLGNTVNAWTVGGREFLREAAGAFDAVYMVPGPAEYAANQNECWRMNFRRLLDSTAVYANIHVLAQGTAQAGPVTLCGATLWGPLTGYNAKSHPDTAFVRERVLVERGDDAADDEHNTRLLLQTIHEDAVRNMCRSDRNFFNEKLLSTYKPTGQYVFGSYHAPYFECLTVADMKSRDVLGMTNDYRFIFRKPLRLWLCGAGVGGKNYYDSDTGVLFAKNARGDGAEAEAGYSPEMFMDVGTTEIMVVRRGERALELVRDGAIPELTAEPVRELDDEFDPKTQPGH